MGGWRSSYDLPGRRGDIRAAGGVDPESALAGPGLGAWDLRSLVGHTCRSLVTVETYLDQPAADIEVATAPDYYVAIAPALAGEGPEIVERGRQAGLALGADPASYVARSRLACATSSAASPRPTC